MAEIRPFEPDDLPTVTRLMHEHLGAWDGDVDVLKATLFDHPWADPETPSLVATDDAGEPVGFIGAQPRRFVFGDRILRAVCCSHLVVQPTSRGGGPGAMLVREMMAGPQEITWTDSANETVARIWGVLGGHIDHARACDWLVVLRPWQWGAKAVGAAAGWHSGSGNLPVPGMPLHAAGPRLRSAAHPDPPQGVAGKHATPAEIAAYLPDMSRRTRLRVAYDEAILEYTLGLVRRARGDLVHRLVKRRGRPVGWYAYLLRPGGVSPVLHLAADPPEAEAVLAELVEHSLSAGSAAISGRYEPHLEEPLRRRMALLGLSRRPVLRSSEPEIDAAFGHAASLLTRLDGEWFVV